MKAFPHWSRRRSLPVVVGLSLALLGSLLVILPQPARAVADSAFQDGSSVSIPAGAPQLLDSIATSLPDATNLVFAFVQIENAGSDRSIGAGDLEVRRGTLVTDPLVAQNEFQMDFQHDASAPVGTFAFLLGRDTSPGANPTYGLFGGASAVGLNAEVKFLILNDVPNTDFVDGGSVLLGPGENTLASVSTAFPNQPAVVIGAIQMDTVGGDAPHDPGDLRLKRGGTVLAANQYRIELDPAGDDGDGAFQLIVARDANPGANPTFSVTADPNDNNEANGEAKIIALSGLASSAVNTGSISVGTSRTVIGSTATTFAAGEDVLIGAFQIDPQSGSDRTLSADRIDIAREPGVDRVSNEFGMTIPASGDAFDNSFVGLLDAVTTGSSTPTYEGAAQATNANWFDMELKLVAIHLVDGAVFCDAITVVTSDPAGELWFNETVEPDGFPLTNQLDVAASFQTGATPALSVTNDGSGTCHVTIRLMSDPGVGRSMKFNTANSPPLPTDDTMEVPLDPASVAVCTNVGSGGTCEIWLWVDYENAFGGQSSADVRVRSL